ncbi:hypothetical protein ACFSC6_22505 [Rufibacter sediminis]|uniref:DUF4488 domain-containing protein n=1 Tax=Rufibacter sediminis TaxID=2762756 RepID=A0ABR6VUS7_9BACT|nr:hypothetical protein [Rufibacter sediminis]MBC3540914.1 hypothetical protein [Rufibacter sediminis]
MRNKFNPVAALALFASLLVASSCAPDDAPEDQSPSIAGLYRFAAMNSAEKVDLNKDGKASTNLLEEIDDYNFQYPVAKLELRPTKYNNSGYQLIDIFFPHPNLTSYTDSNARAIVLHTNNSLNGTGYTYTFDERTKAIEIVRPAHHQKTEEEWGRLNSLTILGTNQLTANVTKTYYDFQTNNWRKLNITVVYEKVE